jgi:hypothetical protein
MKNIHINGLLALILLFNVSCTKWLDVKPKSEIEEEEMFSNEQGYKIALAGAYLTMSNASTYGDNLTMTKLDILAQSYKLSLSTKNLKQQEFAAFKYETDYADELFTNIWKQQFNGIANCNNLISHITKDDSGKFTDNNYKLIYGEALAIRAFLHFDLLRMFHPSYTSNKNYKALPYIEKYSKEVTESSTTEKVLTKVLADLKQAYKLLKQANDPIISGAKLRERQKKFNYYAVAGLLARVYLYKADKVNALKYAKEVIASGVFKFMVSTKIIGNGDYTFSPEHLFSLSVTRVGETSRMYFPYNGEDELQDTYLLSDKNKQDQLYAEKDDLRFKYWFKQKIQIANTEKTGLRKYYRPRAENNKYYDPVIPIIKIAEMYLIAAECLKDINLTEAADLIKFIHKKRAFKNEITITDVGTLMDEISKEYQREFIGEGQLFYFYKRLNKQSIKSYENIPIEMNDAKYTFPLPKKEIQFAPGRKN